MNTHASTSFWSHGSVRDFAVRLGLTLLLVVCPLGAFMTGIVPHELPRPAIVVLSVGLLLVQLVWSAHPGARRSGAKTR